MSENSYENKRKFGEKLDKIKLTVDNIKNMGYYKNIIIVIVIKIKKEVV